MKEHQFISLGLFLFVILFGVCPGDCVLFGDFIEEPADMYPSNDLHLFVGDVVRVYCAFEDASEIYFSLEIPKERIIRLNTTVLNSTHIVHDLKGTKQMVGLTTLMCMGTTDPLSQLKVFVQEYLQPVSNISSVWHYSDKTFEVKWDLGVDYYGGKSYVIVETLWIANNKDPSKGSNCSISSQTSCVLDQNLFKYQTFMTFGVTVKPFEGWWKVYVKNKDYFQTHQLSKFPYTTYPVKPKEKVQPEMPRQVKLQGINSSCLELSWVSPNYFTDFDEMADVLITAKEEESSPYLKREARPTTVMINSTLQYVSNQVVEVCDLYPNTMYLLSLQVKPVKGCYWSDPVNLRYKTEEAVPTMGPLMTTTSFWLGSCNDGKRTVRLYWKDLKPKEANGVLTTFHIKLNSELGEERGSSNQMKTEIDCNVTYAVQVYSATAVGLTRNPSRLIIPSEEKIFKAPFPVDLKVEKLGDFPEIGVVNVNVTWSVQDVAAFKGVSLVFYYCQGTSFTPNVCLHDFTYKVVPFEQQFLELHNISRKTDQFAYALEADTNQLTGMTFIECVFDRNAAGPVVKNVRAQPGEEEGSIFVVWTAQKCSQETLALVLLFQVEYCRQVPGQGATIPCEVVKVEGGDSSSVMLHGLDVEDTYSVRVAAKTHSGLGTPSNSVQTKPGGGSLRDDAKVVTLAVVFGIGVILIVSAVVSWKLRRRYKQRKLKVMMNYPKYLPFDIVSSQKKEEKRSDSGVVMAEETDSEQNKEDDPYATVRFSSGKLTTTTSAGMSNPVNTSAGLSNPVNMGSCVDIQDIFVSEKVETVSRGSVRARKLCTLGDTNTSRTSDSAGNTTTGTNDYVSHPSSAQDSPYVKVAGSKESSAGNTIGTNDYISHPLSAQDSPYVKVAGNNGYVSSPIQAIKSMTVTNDKESSSESQIGGDQVHDPYMKVAGVTCTSSEDSFSLKMLPHSDDYVSHPPQGPSYSSTAIIEENNILVGSEMGGCDDYISHPMQASVESAEAGNGSKDLSVGGCGSDDYVSRRSTEEDPYVRVGAGSSMGSQESSSGRKETASGSNDYIAHPKELFTVGSEVGGSDDYVSHPNPSPMRDPYVKVRGVVDNPDSVSPSTRETNDQFVDMYIVKGLDLEESSTVDISPSTLNHSDYVKDTALLMKSNAGGIQGEENFGMVTNDDTDAAFEDLTEKFDKDSTGTNTDLCNTESTKPLTQFMSDYVTVNDVNKLSTTPIFNPMIASETPWDGFGSKKDDDGRVSTGSARSSSGGKDDETTPDKKTFSLSRPLPPLCTRKISEDEGISSPAIVPESPDFSGHLEPSIHLG